MQKTKYPINLDKNMSVIVIFKTMIVPAAYTANLLKFFMLIRSLEYECLAHSSDIALKREMTFRLPNIKNV